MLASIDTVFNGPRLAASGFLVPSVFMPGGIIKLIILLCSRSVDKPYHFRNILTRRKQNRERRAESYWCNRLCAQCYCILLYYAFYGIYT